VQSSINATGSKTEKEFLPGRFFVCEDPSEQQKNKHDRVTQEKTHLIYSLIRLKMLASCVLLSLAFLPRVQAVLPAPDGGYPGNNTAEGSAALFNLFSGVGNTAVGRQALFFDVTGSYNTAIGFASLVVTWLR